MFENSTLAELSELARSYLREDYMLANITEQGDVAFSNTTQRHTFPTIFSFT